MSTISREAFSMEIEHPIIDGSNCGSIEDQLLHFANNVIYDVGEQFVEEQFVLESINYIEKISVKVYFSFRKDVMFLNILDKKHKKLLLSHRINYPNKEKLFNKSWAVVRIETAIEMIEKIKYCKMKDVFVLPSYNQPILCNGKYLDPHKYQDCSVCLDKTVVMTTCEHCICRQCAHQIKKPKKCPLCRNSLRIRFTYDNDETSDDEDEEEDNGSEEDEA